MTQDSRGIRIAGLAVGCCVVVTTTTVAALALTGVAGPAGTLPTAAADQLPPFRGCAELAAWYRDAALPLVTPYGLPGTGLLHPLSQGAPTPLAGVADTPAAAPAAGAVGNDATGTNVQEAGVDEPDLAKTDGRYVVGLVDDRLYVADTAGTPRVLGTVTLAARGAELLLAGNRALVVSGGGPGGVVTPALGGLQPPSWTPTTLLTAVDLTDRTHPRVTSSEQVDGSYLSARLHDGVVRVVLGTSPTRLPFTVPRYPPLPQPLPPTSPAGATGGPPPTPPTTADLQAAQRAALEANRDVVRRASAQDWLPQRSVRDGSGTVVAHGPLLSCADVHHPVTQSGLRTLSVLTVNLTAAQPFTSAQVTAVTADGDLVYASADHLYVATSRWGAWSAPTGADRPSTQIHEFDISRPDTTSYVATGSVDGFVYGRWAFSELDGRLRVATTTGTPWGGPAGATPATQSRVVVLERSGGVLDQVGEVGGLGRGEMVRAVRWFGELAAVVTFRQTDPLYLVDLSRPAAPRLRGELTMPGYSGYLHPVGDGQLLGIGHDADPSGRLQQLQAALFDVSDPAHPTRSALVHLGYGWTPVESESRAFTYLPARHLAVLPARWYPPQTVVPSGVAGAVPSPFGAGVVAVAVSSGRQGPQLREAARWMVATTTSSGDVQRVLPVGDRLVAVTPGALQLLDPDGLRPLGTVALG